MKTYKETEHQNILKIAQEYEVKGYEVVVEPDPQSLPEFLKGYRPDVIARNSKENVVIEVKSFASLVSPNQLDKLAQAIQGKPGWRLELVVANPKRSSQVGKPTAISPIQDRLASVSQLRDEGYARAALIATLSALEATLYQMDMSSGVSRAGRPPSVIARSSLKHGSLTRQKYEVVAQGLALRNMIMHDPADQTTDSQLIDKLLPIIRELLGRLSIAESQQKLVAA